MGKDQGRRGEFESGVCEKRLGVTQSQWMAGSRCEVGQVTSSVCGLTYLSAWLGCGA